MLRNRRLRGMKLRPAEPTVSARMIGASRRTTVNVRCFVVFEYERIIGVALRVDGSLQDLECLVDRFHVFQIRFFGKFHSLHTLNNHLSLLKEFLHRRWRFLRHHHVQIIRRQQIILVLSIEIAAERYGTYYAQLGPAR